VRPSASGRADTPADGFVRCSVIIPTRSAPGGPAPRCIDALRPQLGPQDEIIVSVDGGDIDPAPGTGQVRVVHGPAGGPAAARNRAMATARGEWLLFLNDDVVPQNGLIAAHRATHQERAAAGLGPAMVLGSAPWAVGENDRVIDRLVRETSWIFFYDRMDNAEPDRDWGFRHAWTLNLSVPREAAPRFDERLRFPMFDDLEWAFRACAGGAVPVLFRADAAVVHHHRHDADALLRREVLLGHEAWTLHAINPYCAAAVFGDRYDASEGARARAAALLADAREAARAFGAFREAADALGDAVGEIGPLFAAARIWREAARAAGYLAAAEGRGPDAGRIDAFESLLQGAAA
jgi:GT2 family glycosyltransferase